MHSTTFQSQTPEGKKAYRKKWAAGVCVFPDCRRAATRGRPQCSHHLSLGYGGYGTMTRRVRRCVECGGLPFVDSPHECKKASIYDYAGGRHQSVMEMSG